MSKRRLLLLSNSRNADGAFLSHARDALAQHLQGVGRACFVPFAGVTITPDAYTERVRGAFGALGVDIAGVHAARPGGADPAAMIREAEAIVVGGGNTFRLLERLQHHGLLPVIRERVAAGVPYVGWSAGSVVAGPTIGTTNDMPIVQPHDFGALRCVGFQMNAHFTDAHPPGFRGETRRERLAEYVALNAGVCVVGLPEGNWLSVQGREIRLHGPHETPWFSSGGDGLLRPGDSLTPVLEPEGPPSAFA